MAQNTSSTTSIFILVAVIGIPIASMLKEDIPSSMSILFAFLVLGFVAKYTFLLVRHLNKNHKVPSKSGELVDAVFIQDEALNTSLQKDKVQKVRVILKEHRNT